jgi:hypothetical protein
LTEFVFLIQTIFFKTAISSLGSRDLIGGRAPWSVCA